jgi:3-oxoadipate enol-lactonase
MVLISPVPATGLKVDTSTMERMSRVSEDDAALRNAIRDRTGDRYCDVWLDRKLVLARESATTNATAGYLQMIARTDFAQRLAGCETPLLLLLGAHDLPIYPRERLEPVFRSWFPNLEVRVSHEAGHYMMLETPVWTSAQIERFLSDDQPLNSERQQ